MKIIIDVQGFKTDEKTFVAKELAAYNGKRVTHIIFKPPFSLNCLETKFRQQAIWLINNHHCIDWNEGFTPSYQINNVMKKLAKSTDTIYVKGAEKAAFIRSFTEVPVIELPEKPALKMSETMCFHHLKEYCICALSNVYQIYNEIVMQ